eukprot:3235645-Amphidinium_carterae.1
MVHVMLTARPQQRLPLFQDTGRRAAANFADSKHHAASKESQTVTVMVHHPHHHHHSPMPLG